MDDDPILTIGDFRNAYCVRGVKEVMQEAGVDFAAFIRNGGARASQLRGYGHDAAVDRVIEIKRGGRR